MCFCKCCLQCFSSEKVLIEHGKNCLTINGKQSVRVKSGSISFKNNYLFLLKFILIFECILKKAKSDFIECNSNSSYTTKYQDHIHCSFAYKIVCIDNKFSKIVVLYRGKNAVCKFIKSIFSEYSYCRKIIKKHFNENLIMSAEEEERFQLSNIC